MYLPNYNQPSKPKIVNMFREFRKGRYLLSFFKAKGNITDVTCRK